MEELTREELLEAQIGKLNSIISAHEEILRDLIQARGATKEETTEFVRKVKFDAYQKWLEFVETNDPALAAKIDRQDPELLIF